MKNRLDIGYRERILDAIFWEMVMGYRVLESGYLIANSVS
jgi:hypothetical protein